MHLLCAQEIRKTNWFILHLWHITAEVTFVGLHLCLIHKHYRPTDEQYLKRIINFNILISFSRTVSMNKNSGRIRVLSWYLIIAYQSHNKKNDHLSPPREGPRLNAWVSRYHYSRSSNKQLLLWKISRADNQGILLCWLIRNKLNSLTCRFLQVSCRYI